MEPTVGEGAMKLLLQLRTIVKESEAEELRRRIAAVPFQVSYQEQQRGATLVAVIGCTRSQESTIREILDALGAWDQK